MTEQMRSQEEEMRQNMEELQATQESIERSQREVKAKEELFNASNLIVETDRRFYIKGVNELSEIRLKYEAYEFDGMAIEYIFHSFDKIDRAKEKLRAGEKWSDFIYLKGKTNEKIFVKVNASGIRDDSGHVNKFLFLFDDISYANSQ